MSLERIMYEYSQRREQHERERDGRIAECVAADAAIASIRDDIARLCYELAGCPVTGGDPNELSARIAALRTELSRRLAALGHSETYLDVDYDCDLCQDTGYINGRMCDCLRKKLHALRIGELPIDPSDSFDNFDDKKYAKAAAARVYFRKVVGEYPQGLRSYLLCDTAGAGKTFMLKCVAREFADRNVLPLYTTANAMFSDFHRHRLGQDVDLGRYFEAPVLIIDDLGSEPVTYNVTVEYFYNLINERYEKRLWTFISTNLDEAELTVRYDERTMSRLLEKSSAVKVKLAGQDLRQK